MEAEQLHESSDSSLQQSPSAVNCCWRTPISEERLETEDEDEEIDEDEDDMDEDEPFIMPISDDMIESDNDSNNNNRTLNDNVWWY